MFWKDGRLWKVVAYESGVFFKNSSSGRKVYATEEYFDRDFTSNLG